MANQPMVIRVPKINTKVNVAGNGSSRVGSMCVIVPG
jgi:hypothetical protein